LTAASGKPSPVREMSDQNTIIELGDVVCVHAGDQAGEIGTVIDVIWYGDRHNMYALVRVMSDDGITHFFDMRMLEKVKCQLDKDLTSNKAKRTRSHVK
jgi:hypothetical protein